MHISKPRGYTLIEVTLVLVLLGIVSAFVITTWPQENFALDHAIELLRQDIRYAQVLSMSRGQRYRINFTPAHYTLTDLVGNPVMLPGRNTNIVNMPSGYALLFNPLLLANGFIAFDGKGVPRLDATIPGQAASVDIFLVISNPPTYTNLRLLRILPRTGVVPSRHTG